MQGDDAVLHGAAQGLRFLHRRGAAQRRLLDARHDQFVVRREVLVLMHVMNDLPAVRSQVRGHVSSHVPSGKVGNVLSTFSMVLLRLQ